MKNTVRTAVLLCITLVFALVVTGFASSAYKNERVSLGKTHFERGRDLAKQGDEEAAIEEYRQALIFSPDIEEYRLALAKSLIEAGRLDEAQSHLDQLQQQDPTNGLINWLLARVAARRKSPQTAVEFYQRAVYQYWPPDRLWERRQARWELISLLESEHRRGEIVGELMQMYSGVGKDRPRLREEIGLLLLSHDGLSEASQVFRDMLHDTPEDAGGHRGMAKVLFASGEYVEARHEFQRALKLDPADKGTQSDVAVTNEVIDMDPDLPRISSRERLRRSRNLFKAVVANLESCSRTHLLSDELNQDLKDAKSLSVATEAKKEDLILDLQDGASQLWKKRSAFCGTAPENDKALRAVIEQWAR